MQWSNEINAGFSTAPVQSLVHPVINDGAFSFHKVNVGSAEKDDASLLSWLKRLISTRKNLPQIGIGELTIMETGASELMLHRLEWNASNIYFIHNLSGKSFGLQKEEVGLAGMTIVDVFGEGPMAADETIEIGPYSYRWFRTGKT
jgi:maltose alpha-D-glucosyltransferase/alpha-amylase